MIKSVVVAVTLWSAMTPTEARQKVWVSCAQIRQSVASVGLAAAEQYAREQGVSEQDLRRARIKCLRE